MAFGGGSRLCAGTELAKVEMAKTNPEIASDVAPFPAFFYAQKPLFSSLSSCSPSIPILIFFCAHRSYSCFDSSKI
ncbi:hypothetical protein V6N13_030826 [Hibiscus sabdariffa]